MLLFQTPDPLSRAGTNPRTHYWVIEWQAVTSWGMPGYDELADRAGLPLGRYRFHIEGAGYTIDTPAIDVVPGVMDVTAVRVASEFTIDVGYLATAGFRLLDEVAVSNAHVPLRNRAVDVVLTLDDESTLTFSTMSDAMGVVTVDGGPGAANVVSVHITDSFGNSGSDLL